MNGRNWQDLGCWPSGTKSTTSPASGIAAVGAGTYQVNVDGQQITHEGGTGNVQASHQP